MNFDTIGGCRNLLRGCAPPPPENPCLFYGRVDRDLTPTHQTTISNTIHTFITNGDLPDTAKNLISITPSHLYFLPKIHKPNNPGRPIVSACACLTELISSYLDHVIAPLVRNLLHQGYQTCSPDLSKHSSVRRSTHAWTIAAHAQLLMHKNFKLRSVYVNILEQNYISNSPPTLTLGMVLYAFFVGWLRFKNKKFGRSTNVSVTIYCHSRKTSTKEQHCSNN